MSQYSRNERNANAGIVVGITPEDRDYPGESAGGHRLAAALGKPGVSSRAAEPMPRRRSWWAISWPGAPRPHWARSFPSYRPA